MTDEILPEHVAANREAWDRYASDYAEPGHRAWAAAEPSWGIRGVPDSESHSSPTTSKAKGSPSGSVRYEAQP